MDNGPPQAFFFIDLVLIRGLRTISQSLKNMTLVFVCPISLNTDIFDTSSFTDSGGGNPVSITAIQEPRDFQNVS